MPPPDFASRGGQRQEDVVANPVRKRHVPARPEDRRRGGGKGPIEILRHSDPQRARRANCDMRVSREIKKKLQPVAERQQPDVRPAPMRGAVEPGINAVPGQNAQAQQLRQLHHERSDGDPSKSFPDFAPRRGSLAAELRQHLRHAAYGPGNRDRKKCHVKRKFGEAGIEFLLAVNIEEVAERLERPERDAQGKRDVREALERSNGNLHRDLRNILKRSEQQHV